MPKFFQYEVAAFHGEQPNEGFNNVKFKKGNLESSTAAAAGTLLEIIPVHIKNPPVIQFVAFLDSLKDTWRQDHTTETAFGRSSPYYVWKGASRSISLSWAIPSTSVSSALNNMNNLNWFLSSLYPAYSQTENATSIAASPLFRVRYANLIASPVDDGLGILCSIHGANVTHDITQGYVNIGTAGAGSSAANAAARVVQEAGFSRHFPEGSRLLVPKLITIGCELKVVNDHQTGWDATTGEWRGGLSAPGYPYLFGVQRDIQDTPSAGPGIGLSTDVGAGGAALTPGNPADRAGQKATRGITIEDPPAGERTDVIIK